VARRFSWRSIDKASRRYAVEMMGCSSHDLFTDQEANQTLRHLFQFGMRVARMEQRRLKQPRDVKRRERV